MTGCGAAFLGQMGKENGREKAQKAQRGQAATELREAYGEWSLLPLSPAIDPPKAGASSTHSKRFATFHAGALAGSLRAIKCSIRAIRYPRSNPTAVFRFNSFTSSQLSVAPANYNSAIQPSATPHYRLKGKAED